MPAERSTRSPAAAMNRAAKSSRPTASRSILRLGTALTECLLAGLLCNDSQLVREEERWAVQGDPTEAALIVVAEKAGLAHAEINKLLPRLDVIPFESEHQFMATLHGGGKAGHIIYKKGAVERLLDRCTTALDDRGEAVALDHAAVSRAAEEIAARGLRVLAFARRLAPREQRQVEHRHVADGTHFPRAARA